MNLKNGILIKLLQYLGKGTYSSEIPIVCINATRSIRTICWTSCRYKTTKFKLGTVQKFEISIAIIG